MLRGGSAQAACVENSNRVASVSAASWFAFVRSFAPFLFSCSVFLSVRWVQNIYVSIMNKTWISLACTVACSPAFAQTNPETIELSKLDANNLPAVVVHSHQSFESDELAPPAVTVITRDDIETSGYTTIAEIIEKLGFVATRQGLSGTRDATYDLRGYGGTASSNLAVIVDGVRYSVKEQAAARISAVPVQSIEKVEIIRGGSSVAYGDGASAGVIRITTRSAQAAAAPAGSLMLSTGSYGYNESSFSGSAGVGPWSFSLDHQQSNTRNYRRNNGEKFDSVGGTIRYFTGAHVIGLRAGNDSSEVRLPNQLTLQQFKDDPRSAPNSNPNNFSNIKRDTASLFFKGQLGAYEYDVNLARNDQLNTFRLGGATGERSLLDDQITASLSREFNALGVDHQLTVGLHMQDATYDTVSVFPPAFFANISQKSNALFVTDDVLVNETLRVNAGFRVESIDQFRDDAEVPGMFPVPRNTVSRNLDLNSFELGISKRMNDTYTLFSKLGQSFRLPNADDNEQFSRPFADSFIDPQRAKEIEFGAKRTAPGNQQAVRLFFAKLKDEIIAAPFDFGGFVGIANINLDKSERLGVELEHTADLTNQLELRAAYTYLDASIQSGPLDDVRVPLVPSHRAQFGLNYDLSEKTRVDFLLSAQSDQRIGGDLSTPQGLGHIPGYAVADLAVHRTFGKAKVSLAINNLFDRSYYSQAYFNSSGNPAPVGVYPDPERNMKLTARFDF